MVHTGHKGWIATSTDIYICIHLICILNFANISKVALPMGWKIYGSKKTNHSFAGLNIDNFVMIS
jgi:hypothetical protein